MDQGNLSSSLLRSLPGIQNFNWADSPLRVNENFDDVIKELRNPNGRISIEDSSSIIKQLIQQSNDEALCVFSSKKFNVQGNYLLQHLFLSSNNLREALFFLEKYTLLISDNLEISVTHTENQGVCIQLPIFNDYFLAAQRHRTEMLISTLISWIQLLCGQQWRPQAISLPFPETQYKDVYEKNWLSKIEFNAEQCSITFAKSWLEVSLNKTNPHVQIMIRRDVEDEFRRLSRSASLADRVYMAFANNKIRLNANQQEVAELFHISARTLNRHLQKEKTSLKQIVTQVRIEIAKYMLKYEKKSIEEVSMSLGLSGRRTLDRIFIKEVGMSPAKYKQNSKQLKAFEEQAQNQYRQAANE